MSDPNFADVSLLLHMDGADGSALFPDSSSLSTAVTARGNAQVDTAQKKFGTGSALFDGAGDSLEVSASIVDWASDFTIEGFVRPNSLAANGSLFSTRTDLSLGVQGVFCRLQTNGKIRVAGYANDSGTASGVDATTTGAVTSGSWFHFAVTNDSGTWRVFIDGALGASASAGTIGNSGSAKFHVGGDGNNGNNYINGWIDEFRVTNGVARYTSAFTPPAAPFPDSASGPTITSQPANESVSVGDTAEFTVAATGTGTLSYQWKNGADDTSISGATGATYSFTATLPDNGKTYYCTVTDDDGSIDSNTVTLTVSASSTYTPTLADANKVLRFTAASPEVTIPTNASVAFPVGTILTIRQAGTGTLTLVTTGLTINGTVPSWAQHVEVQFRKVGTNEWDVT